MCIVLMLSNVGLDSIKDPTFENISNLKKKKNYKNIQEIFVKCCKRMTYIKERIKGKTENGHENSVLR
jgi:hypothetical protein